jgi:hypothetical protein
VHRGQNAGAELWKSAGGSKRLQKRRECLQISFPFFFSKNLFNYKSLIIIMECINSGAKQIFSKLIDVHMADATSEQKKKLTRLREELDKMPICKIGKTKAKKSRKLSKWQLCIKEERAGKPFDPEAFKKLSKDYKAGKCPSSSFLKANS